jgi:hypothetical protein
MNPERENLLGVPAYQMRLAYVFAAERLKRLGETARKYPAMLKEYAAWDMRRIEAQRQNWGP